MSLGHEHGLVLIGLAGPMDVVNISLSLSWCHEVSHVAQGPKVCLCSRIGHCQIDNVNEAQTA